MRFLLTIVSLLKGALPLPGLQLEGVCEEGGDDPALQVAQEEGRVVAARLHEVQPHGRLLGQVMRRVDDEGGGVTIGTIAGTAGARTTGSKPTITASRRGAIRFIYRRAMYRCMLITTGRTRRLSRKGFRGIGRRRSVVQAIVPSLDKGLHISIAGGQGASSPSRIRLIWVSY